MVIRNRRDEIEITELTKLINNKRVRDIRKYNMEKVEKTLKNGGDRCSPENQGDRKTKEDTKRESDKNIDDDRQPGEGNHSQMYPGRL